MRVGKLTSAELNKYVISKTRAKRKEIVFSAGLAEDCAAVRSDDLLLLTTDPITAASQNAGKLAVIVSANDIASCGGEPFACLLTIIAPDTATVQEVGEVMNQAYELTDKLNIDIIGGHTEFSDSVKRLILCCTMLGKTDKLVSTGGAQVGDSILITKSIGIEATAILAHDYEARLLKEGLTAEEIASAKKYLNFLSVIEEGKTLRKFANSMHDITEGGIYGAVTEMCQSSGVGAELVAENIPVTELTQKICRALGLDAYRIISSGSMLFTTKRPTDAINALKQIDISATVIGKVTQNLEIKAIRDGREELLEVTSDELLKVKR